MENNDDKSKLGLKHITLNVTEPLKVSSKAVSTEPENPSVPVKGSCLSRWLYWLGLEHRRRPLYSGMCSQALLNMRLPPQQRPPPF